ncbi:hypothetical protein LSH36_491g04007 [Paralvinella palmiformis]|uniref:Carbonic anhydrase n=1 Tax=Paralvinella palmiformis TaxID=53620 RepID=A0AAD9JAA5_9ANNE|nr:hypothetical protein LSH36_491g04007 [Paralvinella palmiformis]
MMDVESMIKDVDENDNKYCLIENTGSELLNSDNNNACTHKSTFVPSLEAYTRDGTCVPSREACTHEGTSVLSREACTRDGTCVPSREACTHEGTSILSREACTRDGTCVPSREACTHEGTSILSREACTRDGTCVLGRKACTHEGTSILSREACTRDGTCVLGRKACTHEGTSILSREACTRDGTCVLGRKACTHEVTIQFTNMSFHWGYSKDNAFKDGPLHHSYKLVQFHFHWGTNDNCGSEHTVDGEEFPLELHLVHFNKDIYKDVNEAIDKPGGMLVLGVLFKVGEINEGLQKLIEHFDNIRYSGESVELPDGFDPASLLPHDPNKYWHYYGSLTTPPLHESVNWIVFQETREVSPEQLVEFRKMCNHPKDAETDIESGGLLANNYRPPQDKDFLTEDKNGQKKKVNRHVFSTYKDI